MSISAAGGVRSSGLRQLHPVLRRWVYLNSRIGTEWARDYLDSPWWYNERASLTFFAGAVWSCGGWALEEFSSLKNAPIGATSRARRSGRYDLNFAIGSHEFFAEAKQCWPPLSRPDTAKDRLNDSLASAARDARSVIPWGLPVLSTVFATPRIPASRAAEATALVGAFPRLGDPPSRNYRGVGVPVGGKAPYATRRSLDLPGRPCSPSPDPQGRLTPRWSRPGQLSVWVSCDTRFGLAGRLISRPLGRLPLSR